jgi:hypothetical protein
MSRSRIGVPFIQGKPIGVIGLPRSHVDPFSEHEIDVVTTFAEDRHVSAAA